MTTVRWLPMMLQSCFEQPQHVGRLPHGPGVCHARAQHTPSASIFELYLKIDANQIIEDAQYLARGPALLIALGSYVCEWLIGKTVTEAKQATRMQWVEQFEIPAHDYPAALLMEQAIGRALSHPTVES